MTAIWERHRDEAAGWRYVCLIFPVAVRGCCFVAPACRLYACQKALRPASQAIPHCVAGSAMSGCCEPIPQYQTMRARLLNEVSLQHPARPRSSRFTARNEPRKEQSIAIRVYGRRPVSPLSRRTTSITPLSCLLRRTAYSLSHIAAGKRAEGEPPINKT